MLAENRKATEWDIIPIIVFPLMIVLFMARFVLAGLGATPTKGAPRRALEITAFLRLVLGVL